MIKRLTHRMKQGFSMKRGREAATQFALFAMLVQTMIPFSAAISLPGADAQARQGQSLPGFYLVICTAYGAKTQVNTADTPMDDGTPATMPWDCPVCHMQIQVLAPAPQSPQVVALPHPLPLGSPLPAASERVAALWTAAPGLARAPPAA